MTHSKIFLYLCLSFIGGIFLSSFLEISQLLMLIFLILGLIFISVFWKRKNLVIVGFCLLFLVAGIWRLQIVELKISNNELKKYSDSGETTVLTGVVVTEPDIREKSQKLTIKIQEIKIDENTSRYISGRVLVNTWRYPEYQYGDRLKIIGKLESPLEDINGFNYKDYLKKEGIFSVMNWPEIDLIGSNSGNLIMKILISFKNKLKESLNKVMSPPQSAVLEALFFGDEENISKEWKEKLNLTGTRHITAVSGMNITIISYLILNFLLFLGFWRNQAFYLSVILITLFILMIGAPSSAVRAGIMGILFLFAQHFGRIAAASRTIVFASTLMLFLNPLLLRFDIGFQLSFLAMMGLIYLQPIFLNFFKKIPNIFQLRYTLATTLAAQVFTLPILVYNFGRVPIISPLSNVLIAPLLSLITILGFVFSFSGIIFQPLGWILSWPAWLLLTYIIKIIDFFSQIPVTSLAIINLHWIWLIISYLILGLFTWYFTEKQKLKFLQY